MGLIKPEFQGGAQAVQAAGISSFDDGSSQEDINAYGGATGYAAFAQHRGRKDPFHNDAAVSNHYEDPQIDEIISIQEEQVMMATEKLNILEQKYKAEIEAKPGSGETGAKKDKTQALDETLIKRIGKTLSNAEGPQDPIKLPFEKILDLLLATLKGSFAKHIKRQKCASPVPYNSSTTGYHPMFYVSKERKTTKSEETFEGIPVRYQGFTKSTVWFSNRYPRWGIVARRMQHQSRMKQKNGCDPSIACKAALFFTVFEGFSYVLIERTKIDNDIDKSGLAKLVVEQAAKFVQIWPIHRRPGVIGNLRAGRTPDCSGATGNNNHSNSCGESNEDAKGNPLGRLGPSSSSASSMLNSHLMRVKFENNATPNLSYQPDLLVSSSGTYGSYSQQMARRFRRNSHHRMRQAMEKNNSKAGLGFGDLGMHNLPHGPSSLPNNFTTRRHMLPNKRSFDSTTSSIDDIGNQREAKRRQDSYDDDLFGMFCEPALSHTGGEEFDFTTGPSTTDEGSVQDPCSPDMMSSPGSYSSAASMCTSLGGGVYGIETPKYSSSLPSVHENMSHNHYPSSLSYHNDDSKLAYEISMGALETINTNSKLNGSGNETENGNGNGNETGNGNGSGNVGDYNSNEMARKDNSMLSSSAPTRRASALFSSYLSGGHIPQSEGDMGDHFDNMLSNVMHDYDSSNSSQTTTLHDMYLENSDDGMGGSYDPHGEALCDKIFKTFCDSMEATQFSREYERVQRLLSNRRFAITLRMAIDNQDPRLTQDFLYPDYASAKFLDGFCTATLELMENQVGSNDFFVKSADAKCKDLLKLDPLGLPDVFESMNKSDMSYIMSRYYWLRNKSSSYWFQRILTLGSGKRVVFRGYATTGGCPFSGKQIITVRFQDVSSVYTDTLRLPTFESLE
mmetsp:Transcript_8242/g.14582  ORF Transcript_8242/g.14582 Transcript_8242/m.14582 type:complete len:902 (+) Transcript_8242:135-2840(+)|eukprot:CAMPEP_0184560312 /NCGR_PEP_ID=MMETSP0199_2-20130426/46869_1 /TAXON_ID=1112570 /ORGANISM="Thraustochytrium sp., Strain LLF1b" /LENGTH=901 /DNA_ID=CAMNT_0026957613 /DNA_START=570 /DNA_END=3275 /DNA_ORIENTATION=-